MDDQVKAHRDYWIESQAGSNLMTQIYDLINAEHESAEKNPNMARDHTQRAKGMREVISLVNSLSTGVKKGAYKKN